MGARRAAVAHAIRTILGRRARRWLAAPLVGLIAIGATLAFALGGTAGATPTCTIYWTGTTDNDWGTGTNWSTTNNGLPAARTPASTDFVCMSTAATNTAVDLGSGTIATIAGINWPSSSVSPSLEIDGSLTIGTSSAVPASTINVLNVSGGTLALYTGEALTTANLTSSGNLQGPGTLTDTGPATLTGGSLGSSGNSGTGAHVILEGATAVSSGTYFYEGSELENSGSSAVLTLADGAALYDGDENGNSVVNDSGATITTAANATNTYVDAPAVNNGTVSAKSGVLSFGEGTAPASDAGTFTASSGATLDVAGTQTEKAAVNYAGAGTTDVTGTVTFGGAATLTSTGHFEIDGTAIVSSGITLTAANVTLDGYLHGPGTLAVTGSATLNGPTLGSSGVSGSGAHLTLEGTTTATSYTYLYEGSELENSGSSAVLTLTDGSNLYDADSNGNSVVNDSGATLQTSGNASNTYVDAPAVNNGTVSAKSGVLNYGAGTAPASDAGTFTASSGATVDVAGTQTETAAVNYAGAGTTDVTGTVTFGGAATLTSTGHFKVDGTAIVSAGITLTAANLTLDGYLQGPGTLAVNGPATLNAPNLGSSGVPGTGAHLTLEGATTASGYMYFYEGSELENKGSSAVLTLAEGAYFDDVDSNGNSLANDATATITTTLNAANTYVYVPAVNDGTVSAKSGILHFGQGTAPASDAGTFTASSGATVDVAGTQTETAAVNYAGAGTTDVTGTVTFGGAATLTSTGHFEIDGVAIVSSGITLTAANLTLDGDLQGPGTLAVTGSAALNDPTLGSSGVSGSGVHLILEGASTATSNWYFYEGSELENKGSSAVLTLTDSTYFDDGDGDGNSLVNDSGATLQTSGNAANTAVDLPAVNNGTVSAKSGVLTYGEGTAPASDAGTFTASSGATLKLSGTQTETTGVNYAGAGTTDITGQVTFGAAATLTSTGTFEIDGTAIVSSGVTVTAGNLTLAGDLQGPGTLAVNGPATLNYSELGLSGTSGTAAHLILTGATTATTYTYLYEGSELENKGSSAVLTLADGSQLTDGDGAGNSLVNDSGATLQTSGTAANTYVNLPAVNNGTVSAKSGILNYGEGTAPASDAGTFTAASGATLKVVQTQTETTGVNYAGTGTTDITGQVTFGAAATLTSTGTFEIDGTAIVSSGVTVTADNLTLDGDLQGPGDAGRERAGDAELFPAGFVGRVGNGRASDFGGRHDRCVIQISL